MLTFDVSWHDHTKSHGFHMQHYGFSWGFTWKCSWNTFHKYITLMCPTYVLYVFHKWPQVGFHVSHVTLILHIENRLLEHFLSNHVCDICILSGFTHHYMEMFKNCVYHVQNMYFACVAHFSCLIYMQHTCKPTFFNHNRSNTNELRNVI